MSNTVPTNENGNPISLDEAAKAKAATAEPATPAPSATPSEPVKETDWKAEARKWEERAKSNKEAAEKAAKYDELIESQKTEQQKKDDLIAELQGKVKEFETRDQIAAWKAEVAEATGVPANALAGSTKEEIEAHAETLKPLIAQTAQPPTAQAVATIGNQPDRPHASIPIADQIAAAEAAGDKALVATLKAMQLGTTP